MAYIRREIPITEVADKLGIRRAGASLGHCWRVDAHKNNDRTPSLSFHRNRAMCHRCDAAPFSSIDLVMMHEGTTLRDAVDWICVRWDVPVIAKNQKVLRPERWYSGQVGLSHFPLEYLVRSGFWASLDDAGRAILVALFCFADSKTGNAMVSYRALCRFSGKSSRTTISKTLHYFEHIGLVEVIRTKDEAGLRQVSCYRLTSDSPRFQSVLRGVHEQLRADRDLQKRIGAEMSALPPKQPSGLPKSTTLSTTLNHPESARHTTVDRALASRSSDSERKPSKPVLSGADSKATWETPRFTLVDSRESSGDDMARAGVA
jgi:hypothetical protein